MPPYQYQFPARALVSQQDAAYIENANIPRSRFINRWNRKTCFDAGFLVPFLCEEILPGDHVRYNVTAYIRTRTLLYPNMDQLRFDTHFFYIPNRIVWTNWPKMMGEQDSPGASIAFTIPRVVIDNTCAVGSLVDHMNLPVAGQMGAGGQAVNSLPFRMYNMIYNTWFRDENLATPATFVTNDGPDTLSWYNLLKRAKSHDYFTSALPWPQKFTAPNVPVLGTAPVTGIGSGNNAFTNQNIAVFEANGTNPTYAWAKGPIDLTANDSKFYVKGLAATGFPQIFADLSAATGVSVNQFRQAIMIQTLLERDARGGTRYIEQIRQQYGIIVPDFRLQRPEYIGGGQSPVIITPIAQTAPTATPAGSLGALGGTGTAAGTHKASYAAVEHGYIIGVMSIKGEISYQQGIERHWKRFSRYDWYVPALAQLGEQAVLTQEIYSDASVNDGNTWGYVPRWEEYRTHQSEITGRMRSTASGTLDAWHLGERFSSAPALNQTFIQETIPMARAYAAGAATDGEQFLADINYQRDIVRPVPSYGTPASLGRF